MRFARTFAVVLFASSFAAGAADPGKVLRTAFSIAESSFDPVLAYDAASNSVVEEISESMLEYEYLARPVKLAPLTLERLPEDCRPAALEEALRIQAATVAQLGESIAGWKVGGVIDGVQSYGVLLGSRIVRSGSQFEARDAPLLGMEAEIGLSACSPASEMRFFFLCTSAPKARNASSPWTARRTRSA